MFGNYLNHHTLMEVKELYEAPVTRTLEFSNEGIICLSPGEYPQWQEENI